MGVTPFPADGPSIYSCMSKEVKLSSVGYNEQTLELIFLFIECTVCVIHCVCVCVCLASSQGEADAIC